jgi:hypothetical protein
MDKIGRGALIVFLALASFAAAQTPDKIRDRYNAHKSDFDYLLGDWEFTAHNEQYGTFGGRWSAIRIGDGPLILDEYRVTGDKGETYYVTRTLRAYNPTLDRWDLVSTEMQNGLQNVGTGNREGDEVHIAQNFGPATLRIRYYNIKPDSFSWTADRSTDGGKTWKEKSQTIEARRIGPARAMPSITPERNRRAAP